MSSEVILQSLLNGLLMGGIFALVAMGLTLIFGLMKIINFAHGEFLMVAMFSSFMLFSHWGVDPYLSVLFTLPMLFVLGIIFYNLLIKPILKAPPLNQALITLGVSIFLKNLAMLLFTADPQSIQLDYFRTKFVIGLVVIPLPKLIAALGSFIVAASLFWFLRSTDTGRCFRAAAQDREAAGLMGIDVNIIYYLAVGIGIGCLGIAGPLLIPLYYTSPEIGMLFTMLSFVIVVLGGLGSFTGAIVGGLIIGVSESLGAALFPGTLNHMITYILFILILLFRPEGLFGVKSR